MFLKSEITLTDLKGFCAFQTMKKYLKSEQINKDSFSIDVQQIDSFGNPKVN